ncbi:MAG: hypothetical protein WC136_03605 [Sphaerochaeta sp.]
MLHKDIEKLGIGLYNNPIVTNFEFFKIGNDTVSYDHQYDHVSYKEFSFTRKEFLNYMLIQNIILNGWDIYSNCFMKFSELHKAEQDHIVRLLNDNPFLTKEELFIKLATSNSLPFVTASIYKAEEKFIKNLRRKMRQSILTNLKIF